MFFHIVNYICVMLSSAVVLPFWKEENETDPTTKYYIQKSRFYSDLSRKLKNVLTRRREYGTYLATARRHRRRLKMQKRDE